MTAIVSNDNSRTETRRELDGRAGSVILFGEMLADVFPDRTVLGGAPFNAARHLRAFRQHPVLITRLGDDPLQRKMIEVMSREGMDTLGVQYDNTHPTGQVKVSIENGEPRFDIMPEQAYDFIKAEEARKAVLETCPAVVYFGTLAQRNKDSADALKAVLGSTDALKFLDINLRAPWFSKDTLAYSLQNADMVKLNDGELVKLAEMFAMQGKQPREYASDLANRFGIEQVVVTCGAKGAWMMGREGKFVEAYNSRPLESMADTVGAGDGFASICILGTLLGWPMQLAMERAHAFAAAICGIRGAVPDNDLFYNDFLREWGI